jgi:hypothetical protein
VAYISYKHAICASKVVLPQFDECQMVELEHSSVACLIV